MKQIDIFKKLNIRFSAIDTTLKGWFFKQTKLPGIRPTIIMSHGFTALKEHYLEKFATEFAKYGLNTLIFDHRNFGDSLGLPRGEIDPLIQARDYRHAITFAETLDAVDGEKIGVWGTSLSGGHALVAAAIDHRIKCVVSQVPFISGYLNREKNLTPSHLDKICSSFDNARRQRTLTGKPTYILAAAKEKQAHAALKSEAAFNFFSSVPKWENKITMRSLELLYEYDPINYIERINSPVLMIVASEDSVNEKIFALQAFNKIKSEKELIEIVGDHFCPYFNDQFDLACSKSAKWFLKYLA